MDDLISRKAAIEALQNHYEAGNPFVGRNTTIDECVDALHELPAIDPMRHGMWVSVPHKKDRICSTCYSDEPYKFADEDANVFDYCPHCGTKMDAKEVWIY